MISVEQELKIHTITIEKFGSASGVRDAEIISMSLRLLSGRMRRC